MNRRIKFVICMLSLIEMQTPKVDSRGFKLCLRIDGFAEEWRASALELVEVAGIV